MGMGHTMGFATQVWRVWVQCQICQPVPTLHPLQITCGSQPPIPMLIHICHVSHLTHFNCKLLAVSPSPAVSHPLPPCAVSPTLSLPHHLPGALSCPLSCSPFSTPCRLSPHAISP